MTTTQYQQQRAHLMPTYSPPDIIFTRGEGAYLFDGDGNQYLDFIAGIAVSSLGHSHPYLIKALTEQATKLWHLSGLFRVPQGEQLATRLCELSGMDIAFLANSGTEAVECGLKMMRRYHFDNGNAHKYRIIGTHGSFHGRTHAAICAAGNPVHIKGFTRGDEGYDHVAYNNIEAMRNIITEETAGIIVEPIQGEGGIDAATDDYLRALRKLCDDNDLVLMFDEVQCGVGRSGQFYAHEQSGVKPDIIATAKGIGSGFPLGACLGVKKIAKSMVVGTHGSTYGGNPLATTVGNAVLDIIDDTAFLNRVKQTGARLKAGLESLQQKYPQLISEVRGRGLMLGVVCQNIENLQVLNKAREQYLLIGRAGDNTVRIMPPLIIDDTHVSNAMSILDSVFESFAS